jgi:YfiH family protein
MVFPIGPEAAQRISLREQSWRAKQVHSADAVTVDASWDCDAECEADALVTRERGIVLGIVTADCAPILLADTEAGVIGAAHAGWRGARAGIIANTVAEMELLGAVPARIAAVIGPTIAQASYEVDAAMRDQFEAGDMRFFQSWDEGKWQFNLPGYAAEQLRRAGAGSVTDLALDTYADETQFFSYRRATHRGEETGGRQISMIGLHQSA